MPYPKADKWKVKGGARQGKYLVKTLHRIRCRNACGRNLLRNHTAQPDSNRHPMAPRRRAPAVRKVSDGREEQREDVCVEAHFGLLVAFVAAG